MQQKPTKTLRKCDNQNLLSQFFQDPSQKQAINKIIQVKNFNFHTNLLFLMIFQLFVILIFCQITFQENNHHRPIQKNQSSVYSQNTENPYIQNGSLQKKQEEQYQSQQHPHQLYNDYIALFIFFCIILKIIISQSQIINEIKQSSPFQNFNQDLKYYKFADVQIKFSIQCFHEEKDPNSQSSSMTRVVTFINQKVLKVQDILNRDNINNHIMNDTYFINKEKNQDFGPQKMYVITQFQPLLQYESQQDKTYIQTQFRIFVDQNTRDDSQQSKMIVSFKEKNKNQLKKVYFNRQDHQNINKLKNLFIFIPICFLYLFLSWLSSILIQFFYVQRYRILISKKVKLRKDQNYNY